MQPFELVIMIMIADLAATPMENAAVPLVNGVIPIITLLTAEIIISYISLKSEGFRKIICGRPSIIINKGNIEQSELRRLRININDLMEQLRSKDFYNINDVEFAILETNGDLNIIPKPSKRPIVTEDLSLMPKPEELPVTLIIDGKVNQANLRISGVNWEWVEKNLRDNGIDRIEQVFFAFLSSDRRLYVQKKNL